MSWDIILFNSQQKINSIEELDEEQLESIDFCSLLEEPFDKVIKDGEHRKLIGEDFSIEYFTDAELASNIMVSLYGENGIYALIELAKRHGWQVFDTSLDEMIDLKNPARNGYKNYKEVISSLPLFSGKRL